jgi:hypothetical protein
MTSAGRGLLPKPLPAATMTVSPRFKALVSFVRRPILNGGDEIHNVVWRRCDAPRFIGDFSSNHRVAQIWQPELPGRQALCPQLLAATRNAFTVAQRLMGIHGRLHYM